MGRFCGDLKAAGGFEGDYAIGLLLCVRRNTLRRVALWLCICGSVACLWLGSWRHLEEKFRRNHIHSSNLRYRQLRGLTTRATFSNCLVLWCYSNAPVHPIGEERRFEPVKLNHLSPSYHILMRHHSIRVTPLQWTSSCRLKNITAVPSQ